MGHLAPMAPSLSSSPGRGELPEVHLERQGPEPCAFGVDFTQFRSGAQFGAWLGPVPTQNSSGGKASLGAITKRGDGYLRTLLIQGAKSAVMTAHKRADRISQWLVQLKERVGWQKAVVALAKGRTFDPNHVSVKPGEAAGAVVPAT